MKKFALLTVLAMIFAVAGQAMAASFTDVPRTHWAYDAIEKAVAAKILQGYDGKFHGKRLLNRYQMAVIAAKLLDAMGTAPGKPGPMGDDIRKMIANLEALTIEFADELALLNVKVSTLEDSFTELKGEVEALKGNRKGGCPGGEGIGLTGFASFALLCEQDENGTNPFTGDHGVLRYAGNEQTYFTMPQVSLGFDKQVNEGVYLHAQFDYDSEIQGGDATVGINEAYFFVDEIFGDIGGKAGAFAAPFSMEHNGPFRSCNYTITPSIVNTYHESFRYYGLELQKTKDVEPEDLQWKFAVVSGSDDVAIPMHRLTDAPVMINTNDGNNGETDGKWGFYLYVAKKPVEKRKLGWNIAYMDAGQQDQIWDTHFWQIGLEWWSDDFGVMVQYLSGSEDESQDVEFDTWYIMVNWKIDDKASVSLRYDSIDYEDGDAEGSGFTLAYNRKVTDNSMFQFEYIDQDSEETAPLAGDDPEDELWQIRYKVHF